MVKNIKKLGVGSLSLIISIFAIMFSFTYLSDNSIGQEIFHALGVSFPTAIFSLILFSISIIIGYKNKNHRYSESGIILSVVFIVLIFIISILSRLFINI